MKQFLTVLSFEFNKVTKNVTYRVMTIILLLLVVVGMNLPRILDAFAGESTPGGENPSSSKKIIYVLDTQNTGAAYLSAVFKDYDWQSAQESQKEELAGKVEAGDAYGILELQENGSATFTVKQLGMTDTFAPQLQSVLAQKHQAELMAQYNLNAEQIQSVFTPPSFATVQQEKDAGQSFAFTYVLLILMFMSVTMYGQMVTMSVITEKSTRTMEMLVTSANPNNLIFGKILGTGLAGLAQLVLVLASSFVMYQLNTDFLKDIAFVASVFEGSGVSIIIYTVVYYLLGFFLYAFLLGALGSLCSRVEDAQSMITPAMLLLVAGFYIAMGGAITNPNNILIVIASMFPFFAPMVMLVRIGMTDVPFWQIALSIIITAAGVYGMGKLSVMIYRIGVLMYGNRPKPGEIIKALKQAKTL